MKLASVVVFGAVLLVAGCGSPDPESAALETVTTNAEPTSTLPEVELAGDSGFAEGDQQLGILHTGWLLVSGSVDEQSIPTEPDLVMRFGETHLSFPLSCNSGSVPYHLDGTSIEFDLDYFTTTEMRCATDPTYPPDVQARLFETGLRHVDTVAMSDDGQQLEFEGDGATMLFTRGAGDSGATEANAATSILSDELSCSITGTTRFSSSFLEGPDLSPSAFAKTAVGAMMEMFFTEGPGAPESTQYSTAEGFSIVSDLLVLGYQDGLPSSHFDIEGGTVVGWGGCRPNRVADDLVASRWEPFGSSGPDTSVVSLRVEGGACETSEGMEVLTEVVAIETDESGDHVEITVWTSSKPAIGACVGVSLDAEVELAAPLGDRSLLDGGTIPATTVSFSASSFPDRREDDDPLLDALECSPGTVLEQRVPDTGQDPLDVARSVAPDVVEVKPIQPLWWWGLNQNGTVIVTLALGDSDGADYQVWTCDPQT